VEADVGRDLLRVDYDPKEVTRKQILDTVGKEGFEAEVVPAGAGPKGG
jgi:hypothetical protein